MDVMQLIDELETELGDRKGGLFGKKVDIGRCSELVRRLRGA